MPFDAETTDPMVLDSTAIRAHFPALQGGAAHFDAPGGSQTPDVVADAIRTTLLSPLANRGTATAAARNAEGRRRRVSPSVGRPARRSHRTTSSSAGA